MLNKRSQTNLCLDIGFGKEGFERRVLRGPGSVLTSSRRPCIASLPWPAAGLRSPWGLAGCGRRGRRAGDRAASTRRGPSGRRPAALQPGAREDPFTYFRFLNTDWAARVCEAFRRTSARCPTAILHGDAHLEQYALTATAHGLDDFDDAATAPP